MLEGSAFPRSPAGNPQNQRGTETTPGLRFFLNEIIRCAPFTFQGVWKYKLESLLSGLFRRGFYASRVFLHGLAIEFELLDEQEDLAGQRCLALQALMSTA